MRSLQHQLSVMLGLSIAIIFIMFWWLSITTIHSVAENYVLTRLSHDSDAILKNLKFKHGQWNLDNDYIEPIYSQPFSGHYYLIKAGGQILRSPSLKDYPLFTSTKKDAKTFVYETKGPEIVMSGSSTLSELLVRVEIKQKNNQQIALYVAEDHSPIKRSLRYFDWIFGLTSLIVLVVLYLLQKWILKRTFNQLTPLEKQLKALEVTHELNIDNTNYPKEVASLVNALQQALENATAQLKHSRQSNANLSHGLKTPLNLALQLLEEVNEDCSKEQLTLVKSQLEQQFKTIHRLIERELKKARIGSKAPITNRFDFDKDLNGLIQTLQQLHKTKSIDVVTNFKMLPGLVLEKEDGYELFGNLLDNAFKWCESRVIISISQQASNYSIYIENDGQKVDESVLQKILNRGYRADEKIAGHGIGLSIVKDLVEAYDGNLSLSNSDLGGLKVTIIFKVS